MNTITIAPNPAFSNYNTPAYCDERAVEVPWAIEAVRQFSEAHPGPLRLLDVGCSEGSRHLAHFPERITVEGIDIRYKFRPELKVFFFGDIRTFNFKSSESYDVITCVSTLEHIGFAAYGGEKAKDWFKEQIKALTAMIKILKSGGFLFLTLPFGYYGEFPAHVNYSPILFNSLTTEAGLNVRQTNFFHFDMAARAWKQSAPGEENQRGYGEGVPFATGVLCAVLGRAE